jgi:ATP-dependent DNA ligase
MVCQVAGHLGHEGIVAKRLDSLYLPGRRVSTWLKKQPQTGNATMRHGGVHGNGLTVTNGR